MTAPENFALPEGSRRISRREFLKVTAGGALLLGCPAWAWSEAQPGEWWFVHLSDSHNGNPRHAESLQLVLNDLTAAFPQARFTINTGDITEHGWEEELDQNLEVMKGHPHPYYNMMGNHDSRWSRSGRYAFRQCFGATRYALDEEHLSLFLLDCSVLLEQYGHLDPFDLDWLKDELGRRRGKAAVLAFHHPPCDIKRFLDSDGDLFPLIAEHNVAAILSGHIHQRKQYQVNGTWIITSGATMSPRSGYCAFRVRPDAMTLFDRRPLDDQTREVLSIPLDPERRNRPAARQVQLRPRLRRGELRIALPEDFEAATTILQLNGHRQDFQSEPRGRLTSLVLPASGICPGHHEVELCSPGLEEKQQRRAWGRVSIEPPESLGLRWERKLPAGIQSRPAFWKDRLIVAANEGRVRALAADSGKDLWEYDSGPDAVLSSPIVQGDRVYFGTIDGHVVCLLADSGKMVWKRTVEGSVIATGTFAGPDSFVIGTGKGWLYSLEPETAQVQWSYQASNLIKATPAFDGKRLYFGAWDGHFYAVDAKTGTEAWKVRINTPHLSPATCNPGVVGDRVIFSSHDYATHCLDAAGGQHRWRFPALGVSFQWNSDILAKCKPSYSSPVFHKDAVYFGSITGHVVGFDLDSGKQTFELEVEDPIFDSFPLLVGNHFYFGTVGGTLYAVNLDSGAVSWKYSLGPNFIFSPPASDGTRLAIGSLGGQLACLKIG